MNPITIVTLNIAAASKERARRILDEWIAPTSADVYVFTETSDGAGTQLILSEFKMAGWRIFGAAPLQKDRGVSIVSRIDSTDCTDRCPTSVPGRAIVINLNTHPALQLIGMYVPNRGNDSTKTQRKKMFLDDWLFNLRRSASSGQPRILLGDLNVVPTGQKPRFLPQERFEYDWYEALAWQAGLYDAALKHNGSGHEYTWIAYNGEGYTYDHIMLERNLAERVAECSYDHSTRSPSGVTDHSALLLTLKLDGVNHIHQRGLAAAPRQTGLF